MKIAWITDSTACLTEELKREEDVYELPIRIAIGDKSYRDGVDLTSDEFFDMLQRSTEVPKTSQPAIGEFTSLFETLKDKYDAAIAVHVSERLSGTIHSCMQAMRMSNFNVEVIDSKTLSYPMANMIRTGLEMQKLGKSVREMVDSLKQMADRYESYILISNLEQLHKGGRLNSSQFLLGSLLKITPILTISDGEVKVYDKVRTMKKAVKRLSSLFEKAVEQFNIQEIYISHTKAASIVDEVIDEIRKVKPNIEVKIGTAGPALGVHSGVGAIMVSWLRG